MGKCPYCNFELHLSSFFEEIPGPRVLGMQLQGYKFHGESMRTGHRNKVRMYTCPKCDKILGFSEYKWDDD